jgi:hypothetical protein
MNNPVGLRRASLGLIVIGAVIAGVSDGVRAAADSGEANWTYALDVIGILLAVAGGVLEAQSADMMSAFAPDETRRRALVRVIAAIPATLIVCVSLGALDQPVVRGAAGALLVLNLGFGLGGLFTLAWIYGGSYAANRIQDRVDDDYR